MQIELAAKGRYIYAHEISGGWLPEIENIIRQPKYFLNNVQDLDWRPNVDISERVRNAHFPSVFFGASGSSSPLHSDGVIQLLLMMLCISLFPLPGSAHHG